MSESSSSQSSVGRGVTVTATISERWLYDALLYGKPTANFIASVETAIQVLPERVEHPEPPENA